MRRRRSILCSFLSLVLFLSMVLVPISSVIGTGEASAHEGEHHKVLVITKTTGFRHASIDQGAKVVLPQMAEKYGFTVDFTENAADINAVNLAKYDVVFFASTTGNFKDWGLTEQQKQDFMNFIKSGKGYVGTHSATDTGYDWAEYGDLTGAYFTNHPWTQKVTFNVEDEDNPATSHLGPTWEALEEVYYFNESPRTKGKHVLLSLNMTSNGVTGGPFEDHPNAWCSPVSEGRMFYTALGHHTETWFNEDFQKHLLGGLQYAWGEATDTKCNEPSPRVGLQKLSLTKTISSPVGLDIAKNGTVFAISLLGKVYEVSQDGDTKEILNIPTTLEGEHGLMGIALDPQFDVNKYMYLYYTDPVKTANNKLINHLSRFTYQNGKLDAASEQILLELPSDPTCCHQAGYVAFGPDGKLYLTSGDNRMPTSGPQFGSLETSQNLDDMRGSILRINKDGSAPSDNPFYTDNNQRDARDFIYAYGFRNPYRISFETKSNGKMIIYEGDVGPDGTFNGGANGDFDELNAVTAPGQNFGWPYGIGNIAYSKEIHGNSQINTALFAEKFAPTKKPIAFYPYANKAPWGGGGRAAMAGPVYNYTGPNAIPGLQGKFLAYDFARNWVKAVTTDDNGEISKVDDFLSGLLLPIDMKVGPDGALYIAEFGSSWDVDPDESITKVFYGKMERKPVVKAKVDSTSGRTPLTVHFDTTGTADPDGDVITYAWNFGDGQSSTEANPSHTYTTNGVYNVVLTVTDSTDKSSVWNTTITVGNTVPKVKITSPESGQFYTNGQTITFSVEANDEEDGEIPCGEILWSALLLHDSHYHPMSPKTGCQVEFTLLDEGHGPEAKIGWEIIAEVTDKGAEGSAPLSASDSITFRNKRIQAEDFDEQKGTQTEDTTDIHGGKNVGYIDANDWLLFKNIDMKDIEKMYFRMASNSDKLNVDVRLDSPTGEKVATATGITTGGWQRWTTTSAYINRTTSTATSSNRDFHDVYIVFPTGGQNINWLQFAYPGDAPPSEACSTSCVESPDFSKAINRSGWTATASDSGSPASNAFDGNNSTRWTTGKVAKPDMWYQLDMGKVHTINRIFADHGTNTDFFRGYDLLVSKDGQTWTKVASKDTSWSGGSQMDESFEPIDARYVKIVNKGTSSSYYVSIHELYAFAVESDTALKSITAPAPIIAAIGSEKTAAALGLPGKVALVTEAGSYNADVTWDLNGISYDPTAMKAQTFTATGTVTLPNKVLNPNNVPLTTSINVTVNKIPQSQMTATATSEETGKDIASMAIDGNPQTMWHTKWDKSDVLPQSITLNLGKTYNINKVTYLPRQSGSNGNITGYNLYVSTDGVTFTKVANGNWANDSNEKNATFTSANAKYVKLEATEGVNGWASAAEINVFADSVKVPQLVGITAPAAITGVANGTAKTAAALGLPSSVELVTDAGKVNANVTWNAGASSYDPALKTAQTFAINGTVTLPAGVANPNNVALTTSISVTVLAASRSALSVQIEAESFDSKSGSIIIENNTPDTGGGQHMGFVRDGNYLEYKNLDFASGASEFNARVSADQNAGGTIEVRLDSPTGTLAGTLTVSNTGGWSNYQTITTPITRVTGIHDVYLVFKTSRNYVGNLNWFKFDVGSKVVTNITAPAAVTGLTNGTAKTAEALGLPATVQLVTDAGNVNANVVWNVGASSYDPSLKTQQIFTVSGTVTLPAGVVNPNNVALTTSVSVTVLAETKPQSPQSTLTGAQQVTPGQTFDITMGLSNVTQSVYQQMYAQDLTLHYDPAKLQFESVASLKDGFQVIDKMESVPGKIRIVAASVKENQGMLGVPAQGDLLSFKFKVKSGAQATNTAVSVDDVVIANGQGNELSVNGSSREIQISITVDKSQLNTLIASAQAKHNAAVEGEEDGLYVVGSKAQLQSAIDAARATANDPNATQQQVDDAKAALDAAIQVFDTKKITADVNGQGGITIGDLAIVAGAYGKQEGQAGWNAKADVNKDGKVDVVDLAIVAKAILK
ncbi:carbohydrate-binding protein [Paenibacillus sp. GCM10027629]|uniref:carbohydrate-binding protein n=1 Tax=Paenibacillus sp. GCM10027629 TaxID=3273414 RepID=UPI00363FA2A1